MKGYKWIANSLGDVFIVVLETEEAHMVSGLRSERFERFSTDCYVKSIKRFRDGMPVSSVPGGMAYYYYPYRVGQHITGEKIHFCLSLDDQISSEGPAIKMNLLDYEKKTVVKKQYPENSVFRSYFLRLENMNPKRGYLPKV